MRKKRLLIIGCGDVMQRALPWLCQRFKVYVTARSSDKAVQLNTLGAYAVRCDLDDGASLRRIQGLADWIIHSAPPSDSPNDKRTRHLIAALSRPTRPAPGSILSQQQRRAVYISTSGVYGNHEGQWLDEASRKRPPTSRAARRIDAETQLRRWSRRQAVRLAIVRAPGIYALDRLPTARIARGDPGIVANEDSFSNHIHANDLARAVCLALFRGRALRAYNIVDDDPHTMGEWFDQVADFTGLARVARISREQAQSVLSPAMLSYLNESRRISNTRAKTELRWRPRYATTAQFFAENLGRYIATSKY